MILAWRAKGAGAYMYDTVLKDYCGKRGIKEVMLDVFLCNPKSMNFHTKHGFTPFVQIYKKQLE